MNMNSGYLLELFPTKNFWSSLSNRESVCYRDYLELINPGQRAVEVSVLEESSTERITDSAACTS